jgi:hypothetical protein
MVECVKNKIPVKILTKAAGFIYLYPFFMEGINWLELSFQSKYGISINALREYVAFGFTLTGHDEIEPNASPNAERINAMRKLHDAGFKTWASIEPVITFAGSFNMVIGSRYSCDLFKIGLESGKYYDKDALQRFIDNVIGYTEYFGCKLYFKDSLLKRAGINRKSLPNNCVTRDYDIFNDK